MRKRVKEIKVIPFEDKFIVVLTTKYKDSFLFIPYTYHVTVEAYSAKSDISDMVSTWNSSEHIMKYCLFDTLAEAQKAAEEKKLLLGLETIINTLAGE
jgi:hypothetical protein